jgi:hypothetical protein
MLPMTFVSPSGTAANREPGHVDQTSTERTPAGILMADFARKTPVRVVSVILACAASL